MEHPKSILLYPNPVQQKEHGEYHTGYAVSGHKGKVHPAQVVGFYQAVLIYQHGAEEHDPGVVWPAETVWYKKYRRYNKCSGEYM